MAERRMRRVYGLEEAGQLLGGVSAKSVAARARTLERNTGGDKCVLWLRATTENPGPVSWVWASWVEGLAALEGHRDPGGVPYAIQPLPDLPGMPAHADVSLIGAPPIAGVDWTTAVEEEHPQVAELAAHVRAAEAGRRAAEADAAAADAARRDAEALAESTRQENAQLEIARLEARLETSEARADALAVRLAEADEKRAAAEAERERFRELAISALSTTS